MTTPVDRKTITLMARQAGLLRIGGNRDVDGLLVDPAQPLNRAQLRALTKAKKKEARRG